MDAGAGNDTIISGNGSDILLRVPRNRLGEALYQTQEERYALSAAIRARLEQAVHEIFADRAIIAAKAERAIAHIATQHSVEHFSQRMRQLYEESLAA